MGIKIKGISALNAPALILIDEYVPLRFRTYEQPLGCSYLRIGDFKTDLLEFIVCPHTNVLRGLTLTCFKFFTPWPIIPKKREVKCLPILLCDFDGCNLIDIDLKFNVSVREQELLVNWGNLAETTLIGEFGDIRFYYTRNEIRGVHIFNIDNKYISMLQAHHRSRK